MVANLSHHQLREQQKLHHVTTIFLLIIVPCDINHKFKRKLRKSITIFESKYQL